MSRLAFRLHASAPFWPERWQLVLAPLLQLHLRSLRLPTEAAALEATVRPLLLPRERWSDTLGWRENVRLLDTLRSAYLRSRPKTSEQLAIAQTTLQNYPTELPTMSTIRTLFSRSCPDGEWPPRKQRVAAAGAERRRSETKGTTLAQVDPQGTTAHLSLGAVLESSGALVAGRGGFNVWCERWGVYELLSRELVGALGEHLSIGAPKLPTASKQATKFKVGAEGSKSGGAKARGSKARGSKAASKAASVVDEPVVDGAAEELIVLEVGAGSGALAYHLRSELNRRSVPARVVATDDFSWKPPKGRLPDVECVGFERALEVHRPTLPPPYPTLPHPTPIVPSP